MTNVWKFGCSELKVWMFGVRSFEVESSDVWRFACLEFKVWKFGGCKSLIARSTSDGSADNVLAVQFSNFPSVLTLSLPNFLTF